jgi:hypothetical protein
MEEELEFKQSKYNSAIAQLYRLDSLWQACHRYSIKGDYASWNIFMDKIWSELAGDLKEGSADETEFYEITKKILQLGSLVPPKQMGFTLNLTIPYSIKEKQRYALLDKEIWLRRLQNKLGKGSAYADEFEDDFE